MPTVHRPNEFAEERRESLPDGTETVVWAGPSGKGSGFRFNVPTTEEGEIAEPYRDCLPDDLDLSPDRRGVAPPVVFEPGEEIPLPIAREHWHGQPSMVAFDKAGNRLDDRSKQVHPHAIELWKRDREGAD